MNSLTGVNGAGTQPRTGPWDLWWLPVKDEELLAKEAMDGAGEQEGNQARLMYFLWILKLFFFKVHVASPAAKTS